MPASSAANPQARAAAQRERASYAGSIEDLQKFSRVIPVSKWSPEIWHKAAQYGHQDILAWLKSEAPQSMPRAECAIRAAENDQTNILHHMCIDNELTGVHVIAAGQGRWRAAQIICQFPKQLPWVQHPDFRLLEYAVRQGKAEFLDWALHREPPCPISNATLDLALQLNNETILTYLVHHGPAIQKVMFMGALQTGNCHVIKILLRSSGVTGFDVEREWPEASHKLAVRCTDDALRGLKILLPLVNDPTASAAYTRLLMTVVRESGRKSIRSCPQKAAINLGMAAWLVQQVHSLSADQQNFLQWEGEECESLLPLELAAAGVKPRVAWGPRAHSRAAASGSLLLLRWLIEQPTAAAFRVTHSCCSIPRMMLLAHGHSWGVPKQSGPKLQKAEQQRLAFFSVVRWQRQGSTRQACLGHLPDSIVKSIAHFAELDFSWSCALPGLLSSSSFVALIPIKLSSCIHQRSLCGCMQQACMTAQANWHRWCVLYSLGTCCDARAHVCPEAW